MRILAFCYIAILIALIAWLVWEWRADRTKPNIKLRD